jgi:hypothetical protein
MFHQRLAATAIEGVFYREAQFTSSVASASSA